MTIQLSCLGLSLASSCAHACARALMVICRWSVYVSSATFRHDCWYPACNLCRQKCALLQNVEQKGTRSPPAGASTPARWILCPAADLMSNSAPSCVCITWHTLVFMDPRFAGKLLYCYLLRFRAFCTRVVVVVVGGWYKTLSERQVQMSRSGLCRGGAPQLAFGSRAGSPMSKGAQRQNRKAAPPGSGQPEEPMQQGGSANQPPPASMPYRNAFMGGQMFGTRR